MKKQQAQSTSVLPSISEPHSSLESTDNSFLQGQIKLLHQLQSQSIPSVQAPSTGSNPSFSPTLVPSVQTPSHGNTSEVPSTNKAPPNIFSVFVLNTSVESNAENVTVYFSAHDPDSDVLDWTTTLSGNVARTDSFDNTNSINVSFSPKNEGLKPGDTVQVSSTVRDQDGNSDTEKITITIKKSAVPKEPIKPKPTPVVEKDNRSPIRSDITPKPTSVVKKDNRPPISSDHSYYRGENLGAGKVQDPNDRGALIFGRADLDKALNDGYSMEEVYAWLKEGCWREWQKDTKDFRNMKGAGMTKLFPNTEDPSKHQDLTEDQLRANDGDVQAREKIPAGTWKISIICKNASYNQRFLVHSADQGNGAYVNEGATATAVAKKDWYLNIQNDQGTDFKQWQNSILKRSVDEPNKIEIISEDWEDNDFDDFVVRLERINSADHKIS